MNRTARIAGLLILLIAFIAPFSMIYVPTTLFIHGDGLATVSNLNASTGLFRAAIASDAVVFLIEVVLTALLYQLLRPVSPTLSLTAAFARLGMAVVQGLNLLNYMVVLVLVSGAGYLSALLPAQLQALVLLFLDAHKYGVLLWGLFFGLHLLVSGYLVYQSGYLPKLIGLLLVGASVCYLGQSFGILLLPQYEAVFTQLGLLSIIEVVLPLWLIIKGVKEPRQSTQYAVFS